MRVGRAFQNILWGISGISPAGFQTDGYRGLSSRLTGRDEWVPVITPFDKHIMSPVKPAYEANPSRSESISPQAPVTSCSVLIPVFWLTICSAGLRATDRCGGVSNPVAHDRSYLSDRYRVTTRRLEVAPSIL